MISSRKAIATPDRKKAGILERSPHPSQVRAPARVAHSERMQTSPTPNPHPPSNPHPGPRKPRSAGRRTPFDTAHPSKIKNPTRTMVRLKTRWNPHAVTSPQGSEMIQMAGASQAVATIQRTSPPAALTASVMAQRADELRWKREGALIGSGRRDQAAAAWGPATRPRPRKPLAPVDLIPHNWRADRYETRRPSGI